jgi:hypothetical protein
MSTTYTNRKGVTYYLCEGQTHAGKPRYYFAREPQGKELLRIPEGYKISESVNGMVSLVKVQPQLIQAEEFAAVEAEVRRHRRADSYRVRATRDQVELYGRTGADPDMILEMLKKDPLFKSRFQLEKGLEERVREPLERHARFEVILRFILTDAEKRTFRVERRSYVTSRDKWVHLSLSGSIQELAPQMISKLGTDAFFEII